MQTIQVELLMAKVGAAVRLVKLVRVGMMLFEEKNSHYLHHGKQ